MSTAAIDVAQLTDNRDQQYQLLCLQNQVLESIVKSNLDDQALFDDLCRCAEGLVPDALASIMLLDQDGQALFVESAPSAPQPVIDDLQGLQPGPGGGSCGNAVHSGTPTFVTDAKIDPRWADLRDVADRYNISSCWSQPIESENGNVVGSFALTGFESQAPNQFQQSLLQVCANLVSIILQRRNKQDELWRIAHHDALTGLPNRHYVDSQLHHAISNAGRTRKGLALMYIDMDNFKLINDSYGHDFGDRVLLHSMEVIKRCLREGDIVARHGGDEFLLILENLNDRMAVEIIAKKILRSFHSPMKIDGREISVHFSIGISMFPYDGDNVTELMKNADIAMYEAKAKGKNSIEYFRKELGDQILQKVEMEQQLREALVLREFSLYYQPQYVADSNAIEALEVLLRWHHPERGMLLPEAFIPVAEQSDLINELSYFVVSEVCQQGASWLAKGLKLPRLSVNLSMAQLTENCADRLAELLDQTGFKAEFLEFEVTESLLFKRGDKGLRELEKIRAMGVSLVMDDFGTGFSSLSQLSKLPINKIKIDQSFVAALDDNEEDRMIVKTIIAMGQNLGIKIVGEGVESQFQQDFLLHNGCDYIQGHLRHRAFPGAEVERQLLQPQ